MRELLPPCLAVVEVFGDPDEARLLPEEAAAVSRAVGRRRQEYTSVRYCARLALAELGLPPSAIPTGAHREPLWPRGIVGSLTHCDGYRAAALAHAVDVTSVGIDAELHDSLPSEALGLVTSAGERDHLATLTERRPDVHWDHVLFSAKESVFKAWWPLTGRWLGFEDASLRFDPVAGTFAAHLLVEPPSVGDMRLAVFSGRWTVRDDLIRTTVTVLRR